MPCPGRKSLHADKGTVFERLSYTAGEVERRGVKHMIGDGALSVPQGIGMGRNVGVELWELVVEPGKESLARALEPTDTAHVRIFSPAEHL